MRRKLFAYFKFALPIIDFVTDFWFSIQSLSGSIENMAQKTIGVSMLFTLTLLPMLFEFFKSRKAGENWFKKIGRDHKVKPVLVVYRSDTNIDVLHIDFSRFLTRPDL